MQDNPMMRGVTASDYCVLKFTALGGVTMPVSTRKLCNQIEKRHIR